MDLFSQQRQDAFNRVQPLPVRMRPRTLEEFLGQEHFVGPGKLLRRILTADRLSSAIFYGPPGTGKTTLAHIIARHTQACFVELNAASATVKDVREVIERAKDRLAGPSAQRTVLFLDEIHRFNRAQQDVLLNDVENGLIILIGATTENPFFAVNSPLVSRSQIFQFQALTEANIRALLQRAISDRERGMGQYNIRITDEALDHLARTSDGDARRGLLALEVAVLSQAGKGEGRRLEAAGSNQETGQRRRRESGGRRQKAESEGSAASGSPPIVIDLTVAEDSIQRKAIVYDATGDEHYDAASAMIKSMRGSDPDAAVYWVARMLEAGEDPRFIARRIAICAAEDVGNANPQALVVANAAAQVTMLVGMPECQLPLAQAAIYVACSPKSNASAMAIWTAAKDVREGRTLPVPRQLRDTHYRGAERLGHGEGYQYAHDHPGGYVDQDYLGVEKRYYVPTDRGHEARIREYLSRLRPAREAEGSGPEAPKPGSASDRPDNRPQGPTNAESRGDAT